MIVHLSNELPEITEDIFTSASVAVGLRGSGKTSVGVRMAEEAVRCGVPVVVTDPTGVWWGIKSSADGKSAGLPFYVFGGPHADVPLEPDSGPVVAQFVVDERVPVILDLSDMRKGQQRRFVGQFSEALYDIKNRKRDPLLVIYDEAPRFIPQLTRGPDPDLARCIGAVEDVATLGRSRGLGCLIIGQRLATINKNAATQADNLFAMRSVGTPDRKAVDEWIAEQAADGGEQRSELIRNLAALKQGEGYFWSPSIFGVFRRVKFAQRTTFDSSGTPKAGQQRLAPTVFASVDLEALRGEIAAAKERAKNDDPKALHARIADLEKQLRNRPQVQPERIEVPVLLEADRQALGIISREIDEFSTAVIAHLEQMRHISKSITAALARTLPAASLEPIEIAAPKKPVEKNPRPEPLDVVRPLSKAERAILSALAQLGPSSKSRISLVSGYSSSSSTFQNALSGLRVRGYINRGEPVEATSEGLKALGPYEPLPTGRELQSYWLNRLGGAPREILRVLLAAAPRALSKEQISDRSGYSVTSSTFQNALSKLRVLELAEGYGDMRASEYLL